MDTKLNHLPNDLMNHIYVLRPQIKALIWSGELPVGETSMCRERHMSEEGMEALWHHRPHLALCFPFGCY